MYGLLSYVTTIEEDQTYVLEDYKVECSGYVNAWEFCYQAQGVSEVTFYPGIWEREKKKLLLIQSNTVTFAANGNMSSCQKFNLSVNDQFWVSKNTFVGLYSNEGSSRPLLLAVKATDDAVKIHQVSGNQSSITLDNDDENDDDGDDDNGDDDDDDGEDEDDDDGEDDDGEDEDDDGDDERADRDTDEEDAIYKIAIKVYIGEQIQIRGKTDILP